MDSVLSRGDILLEVEREIAESIPFGNYAHINECVYSSYKNLLTLLAKNVNSANNLLNALKQEGSEVWKNRLRDSMTRRIIEDSVCRAATGLGTNDPRILEQLIQSVAAQAQKRNSTLFTEAVRCMPLKEDCSYGYIWLDEKPNTREGDWFKAEILKRLPFFQIETPTQDQINTLLGGVDVAGCIVPYLAKSALSHNFVVVVGSFVDGNKFKSFTVPGLPGVIFLSPSALKDNYVAADLLLHEALHLKFMDMEYFQHFFPIGFRYASSPKITPIWHTDTKYGNWAIDRILTSMHVYIATAIFLEKAALYKENKNQAEIVDYFGLAEQSRFRARWLLNCAREHFEHMTVAGQNFVTWIAANLTALETSNNHDRNSSSNL